MNSNSNTFIRRIRTVGLVAGCAGVLVAQASAAVVTSITDDFSGGLGKWTVDGSSAGVPNEAGSGTYTSDTSTNAGQLTISGTTTTNFWGGGNVLSIDQLAGSLASTVQVDRVSMASGGTEYRTGLRLVQGGNVFLFAHNREVNSWTYNYNIGGGGVGAFGDNGLGLAAMRMEYDPNGGSPQVTLFLNNVQGPTMGLAGWDSNSPFNVGIMTGARDGSEGTTTGVFDNFSAVSVPEPSGALLGLIGAIGFLFVRRRR